MDSDAALACVECYLRTSLEKLAEALTQHIPFGIAGDNSYLKYIPERCLTTYFANTLINNGFVVFNEQSYFTNGGKTAKLDLFARKISPKEKEDRIQLKVEAKGNIDSGYQDILNDITRMREKLDLAIGRGFPLPQNMAEDEFGHKFNMVITTNWGLKEFSKWWTKEGIKSQDAPFIKNSEVKTRNVDCWKPLREKLSEAIRLGSHTLLENKNAAEPYTIDALYAIFPG